MIKYLKLSYQFDVQQIQQELEKLAATTWPLHFQAKHFEGEWSSLALRSIDGSSFNSIISPLDDAVYKDTELLLQSPCLQEILKTFHCPLLAVRLLKLTPGSVIKEHTDADLYYEKGLARFHIPVVTNNMVDFFLQGEHLELNEGECWYCNFNLPHSLANRGTASRIHLVIDAVANDWIRELFNSEKVLFKKEVADPVEGIMDEQTKKETIFHLRRMNTVVSNKLADELENADHTSAHIRNRLE